MQHCSGIICKPASLFYGINPHFGQTSSWEPWLSGCSTEVGPAGALSETWALILTAVVVVVALTSRISVPDAMWKVAMAEEVGKALQSVTERINQAAARRPKVSGLREPSAPQTHVGSGAAAAPSVT